MYLRDFHTNYNFLFAREFPCIINLFTVENLYPVKPLLGMPCRLLPLPFLVLAKRQTKHLFSLPSYQLYVSVSVFRYSLVLDQNADGY